MTLSDSPAQRATAVLTRPISRYLGTPRFPSVVTSPCPEPGKPSRVAPLLSSRPRSDVGLTAHEVRLARRGAVVTAPWPRIGTRRAIATSAELRDGDYPRTLPRGRPQFQFLRRISRAVWPSNPSHGASGWSRRTSTASSPGWAASIRSLSAKASVWVAFEPVTRSSETEVDAEE